MEDNLTNVDPLSYTTDGSQVDLELRGKRLLPLTIELPLHSFLGSKMKICGVEVNTLQVFQVGSEIENLKTNGSRVRPGKRLLALKKPTPHVPVEPRISNIGQTDR